MSQSQFGRRFTQESGIVSLMEDLGSALNQNPDLLFLGGGNPALVSEFEALVAEHLSKIANSEDLLHKLVGVYQSPQGSEVFIREFVDFINKKLSWNITSDCVAITNGSQSAFFILLNMFSGVVANQKNEPDSLLSEKRHIVFPMMPEYLGYADQTKEHDVFRSYPPKIVKTGEHRFKYQVDFDAITLNASDAAICVSRPTNPSGNVLSLDELKTLSSLAKEQNIPFIIDCAYGAPFPNILYSEDALPYADHHIYVMSCSKLGLPGARTGIVVANPSVIQQLANANTILSLASGNLGPVLMTSLLKDPRFDNFCETVLLPFYRARRDFMVACIEQELQGLNYYMHEPEGAFFIWLWFPDLQITSEALYQSLKDKGVLIMAGEHFFFAKDEKMADHASKCIRLTYCQSDAVIKEAIKILGKELQR